MGAIFGQLANAFATAKDKARQMGEHDAALAEQKRTTAIQQAAMLAGLLGQGIDQNAGEPGDSEAIGSTGFFRHASKVPPKVIKTDQGIVTIAPDGSATLSRDAEGNPVGTKQFSPRPMNLKSRAVLVGGKPSLIWEDPTGNRYDAKMQPITDDVQPIQRDPIAEHAKIRDYDVAHPLPVAPDRALATVQDPSNPDGPGVIVPRGQAIGQHVPQKPKAENAMNVAADARLRAAVSEMNNAHRNMQDYETRLATGRAKISAGAQLLQRVANAFTHDDPLSQMAQSGALAALNASDPDLARYIRRGLSFAEGESMISQRPSDFRTKMAAFLSTAGSHASPDMIHDIAGRRQAILDPLNEVVVPASPTSPAKSAKKPTQKTTGGDYGIFGRPQEEEE